MGRWRRGARSQQGSPGPPCAFQIQCKLFVFDKTSQSWVERGRGLLRLNDMASADDGTLQSRLGECRAGRPGRKHEVLERPGHRPGPSVGPQGGRPAAEEVAVPGRGRARLLPLCHAGAPGPRLSLETVRGPECPGLPRRHCTAADSLPSTLLVAGTEGVPGMFIYMLPEPTIGAPYTGGLIRTWPHYSECALHTGRAVRKCSARPAETSRSPLPPRQLAPTWGCAEPRSQGPALSAVLSAMTGRFLPSFLRDMQTPAGPGGMQVPPRAPCVQPAAVLPLRALTRCH